MSESGAVDTTLVISTPVVPGAATNKLSVSNIMNKATACLNDSRVQLAIVLVVAAVLGYFFWYRKRQVEVVVPVPVAQACSVITLPEQVESFTAQADPQNDRDTYDPTTSYDPTSYDPSRSQYDTSQAQYDHNTYNPNLAQPNPTMNMD
jgi:hypothetical protein